FFVVLADFGDRRGSKEGWQEAAVSNPGRDLVSVLFNNCVWAAPGGAPAGGAPGLALAPEIESELQGVRSFSFTPQDIDAPTQLPAVARAVVFVYASGMPAPDWRNADYIVKAAGFLFNVSRPRVIQLQPWLTLTFGAPCEVAAQVFDAELANRG